MEDKKVDLKVDGLPFKMLCCTLYLFFYLVYLNQLISLEPSCFCSIRRAMCTMYNFEKNSRIILLCFEKIKYRSCSYETETYLLRSINNRSV